MADRKQASLICENLSFAAREAFKRLRTNIEGAFNPEREKCPIVGVTSAQPSEGKSTVSVNLAYSLAEHGHKVILLDADLRRPSVYAKLNLAMEPGLSTLLTDANNISSCIQTYSSQKDETVFDVVTSGNVSENPSELLDSKRLKSLLSALSARYDYIIIDLPPVGSVVDAVAVSKHTDGMIVVIRENSCSRGVFGDCIDQLEHAKANILGFVMNGTQQGSGKKYKYYSNYY